MKMVLTTQLLQQAARNLQGSNKRNKTGGLLCSDPILAKEVYLCEKMNTVKLGLYKVEGT
jgi:hypothetical protein